MNNGTNGRPPGLPGCSVLPPTEPPRPRPASISKGTEKPKRTAATSNRFGELNAFVDCSVAGLSRAELGTWLVLWRDTKKAGTVRTSSADIGRRIGASRRAVTDALSKLRKRGLLRLVHQRGLTGGMSVYRVVPLAKLTGRRGKHTSHVCRKRTSQGGGKFPSIPAGSGLPISHNGLPISHKGTVRRPPDGSLRTQRKEE